MMAMGYAAPYSATGTAFRFRLPTSHMSGLRLPGGHGSRSYATTSAPLHHRRRVVAAVAPPPPRRHLTTTSSP